jgi:hypothetical protein
VDLALTAIYYVSFGWHTREEYAEFAETYGFDIMGWPGYPVMRSVPHSHLGHQEGRRKRPGRTRSTQAHLRSAHRSQPQGLAALLDSLEHYRITVARHVLNIADAGLSSTSYRHAFEERPSIGSQCRAGCRHGE